MRHLLSVTVTKTIFDLSVQTQVTYRSHVMESNFTQHTHVFLMGIEETELGLKKSNRHSVHTDDKSIYYIT